MPFLLFILALVAACGGLYAHYRCVRGGHRRELAALLAVDAAALLFVGTAAVSSETFEAWMQEDGWVEWATFIAFTAAAILFALETRRRWHAHTGDALARAIVAVGLGGTALFCLVVAGEEISWGQRLFALQPPEVFLQSNYQQELNVHNLLKGKSMAGLSLESKHLVALIACLYGLLYPAAVARLGAGERQEALRSIAAPAVLAPGFAIVALAELTYPVSYTGEAAELMLGLAFLLAAVLLSGTRMRQLSLPPMLPAAAVAAVLVGGLALQSLVPAILYSNDAETIALTRGELDQLATALADGHTTRLERKRSVHKRVYTAVVDRYFEVAAALPLDGAPDLRARYFIDPWNNPYWVRWSKKANAIVVYSFGPNRRRDTDFKAMLRRGTLDPQGDDIAALFRLSDELAPPARRADELTLAQ